MADFEIVNGVLKKYTGNDKEVIIPEGVVVIDDHSFTDAHFMESITFPSTLRKIGRGIVATDYAGYEYVIKRVNVDSLETWMNIEFSDDKANLLGATDEVELYIDNELVTDLVIPSKYKVIKANSFFGYKKLRSVVIEEGVEVIERGAFVRSGVTKVVLPNTVIDLMGNKYGSYFSSPFQFCNELKEINIPKGIKELPISFVERSSITSIELPEGIEVIPSSAFNSCKFLKSINIPSSVHTIESHALSNLDSIEEIIIPDNVHHLGIMTLSPNTRKVIFPEEWDYIGNKYNSIFEASKIDKLETNEYDNALYLGSRKNPYQILLKAKNKDISSCVIHKDCQYICGLATIYGEGGFYECKNIKSLSFPKGIKRIEFEALGKCDSLESIDLPSSFGSLDPKVYDGSPKLKIKEFGVKDKVIRIIKSALIDDEVITENFTISKNGIDLISIRKLSNGETLTTSFKKKNKISSERLILIFSLLFNAKEMKKEDYQDDNDVYKVSYPLNDKKDVTKYLYFDEDLIKAIYPLVNRFIGEYFLINTNYKDIIYGVDLYRETLKAREEIELEYQKYNLEQLVELLDAARNNGDYLSYEKINLYMNKLKNNGKWNESYGEE